MRSFFQIFTYFFGGIGLILLPFLLAGWQVYSYFDEIFVDTAECAVIFGAAVWKDDIPSHALSDRINAAADLYQKGQVACLILSGGDSTFGTHETDVMEKELLGQGIPQNVLKKDYKGFSTWETLQNLHTLDPMPESFVMVSHDFHLGRIQMLAEKERLAPVYLHRAGRKHGAFPKDKIYVLREVLGILWYYFQ